MVIQSVRQDVSRRLRQVIYAGRGHCNLCGSRVRFSRISRDLGGTLSNYRFPYSLDQFETLNHRGYMCLVCGASDRDRLYALYLERFLPAGLTRRVLDFAPSEPLSEYLRGRGDLEHRTADLMMPGVDDVVDITDMAIYADGSFDFFICSHVLEHVSDDSLAIAELYRVLSPGGSGIVMVPIAPDGTFDEDPNVSDEAERWRRFAQGDHVRLYDRATLLARLQRAGFEVSSLDVNTFGGDCFAAHGIAPGSVLYVVRRP